jgi:hypothetical protein
MSRFDPLGTLCPGLTPWAPFFVDSAANEAHVQCFGGKKIYFRKNVT